MAGKGVNTGYTTTRTHAHTLTCTCTHSHTLKKRGEGYQLGSTIDLSVNRRGNTEQHKGNRSSRLFGHKS